LFRTPASCPPPRVRPKSALPFSCSLSPASHAGNTWLLARRVPLVAVANRLGHANPVITMMVYAHVDRLVEHGELTAEELGLDLPGMTGQ
jgi:hypothetical protein